jgi:ABC-2 type transport system permease protein
LNPGARLYWEVAARAFERQRAYATANLAGLVTNGAFGYLRAVVYLSVYRGQDTVAGYSLNEVISFTWITQALLMVVALWGWWEIEETIRSGDVVSDLAKPFSYLGYWFARDLGRAAYFLLYRGIPILMFAQLTFGLRWPASPLTWVALALSMTLSVTVSFAWRFLLNAIAFWTTDSRSIGNLASIAVTLASGLIVPLPYFPDWIRGVIQALPFAGLLQTPTDVFLEHVVGSGLVLAIGQQLLWSVIMLAAAQLVFSFAVRRLVVQGG